jgi:hypothetical protein
MVERDQRGRRENGPGLADHRVSIPPSPKGQLRVDEAQHGRKSLQTLSVVFEHQQHVGIPLVTP